MKKQNNSPRKKQHAPGCRCSLCDKTYTTFSFKDGYVCESCLDYIKNGFSPDLDSKDPDNQ